MGCKRVTPSNHYIQSFNRDNVSLVTDKIKCFTENGIQTEDGIEHEFDTIIYCTGFNLLRNVSSVHVYGRKNESTNNGPISLAEQWGEQPNAYKGIVTPGYPNSFNLLGPGTGLGHNTILFMIECQVTYVIQAIKAMVNNNIKSLEVKKEVNEVYQGWAHYRMKNKAFQHPSCISYYKNDAGVNWTLWPSHLTHYWWLTRQIELSDFIIKE